MFNNRISGLVRTLLLQARFQQVFNVESLGARYIRSPANAFVVNKLNVKILQFHATILSLCTLVHMMTAVTAEAKTAKATKEDKEENVDLSVLVVEADDFFNQNKFSEIVELLQHLQETDNVDILWRLSRALYNMANEDKTSKRNDLMRQSFSIVQRALTLNDKHYAVHKWYALLLDETAALDGTKARINVSMTFKEHMLKATELNPADGTSLYILGSWCYAVAELPWYQRKIAAALFATPPSSTYEEALVFFLQAETVEPNFYSRNLLMLGKTYLRLHDHVNARLYLSKAALRPARTDEDQQACKEAEDLLKQTKA